MTFMSRGWQVDHLRPLFCATPAYGQPSDTYPFRCVGFPEESEKFCTLDDISFGNTMTPKSPFSKNAG